MEISQIQSGSWQKFENAIKEEKISNAYIIYGSPGSGKEALALQFISQILSLKITDLSSNENITFIAPASKDFYQNLFKSKTFETDEYNQWKEFLTNKMYNPFSKKVLSDSNNIPVITINNLKEKIYFKTNDQKIVLIFNSEALSHGSGESANMLLKVLEEPPSNTTFILVTDYIEKVMPTIKSRCQSVYVPRLTNESIKQFFAKNNIFSSNFISFITDNNLNTLNSLNSFDKEEILDCIKDYFNAIRYKNAESISNFIDKMDSLYKSSRNEFDFHLSVIGRFIKLISMINQSIEYDIEFEEFEELALIINKKFENMDQIKLIKSMEEFATSIDGNANLRLSLMNMIINSNKALN